MGPYVVTLLVCWQWEEQKEDTTFTSWSSLVYAVYLYHGIHSGLLLAAWSGQERTTFPFII